MKQLNQSHPALKLGTTIFLKQVKDPGLVKRLLQPASTNSKLGGSITKGKWKGMPMYALSLEERKTCPTTCQQWANCYGNNMPFANRIDHADAGFLPALQREITSLGLKHPAGFVIRLHVLGDFYSVPYVRFWERMIKENTSLRIFGYTHRSKKTSIGSAISRLNASGAWIRWSDAGGEMSANTDTQSTVGEGIHCPEQTGQTAGCNTCGLCWSTTQPIRFSIH